MCTLKMLTENEKDWKINHLNFYLKRLEKQKQIKIQRKELLNIGETNEI